jgi:hypothetical protein
MKIEVAQMLSKLWERLAPPHKPMALEQLIESKMGDILRSLGVDSIIFEGMFADAYSEPEKVCARVWCRDGQIFSVPAHPKYPDTTMAHLLREIKVGDRSLRVWEGEATRVC